MAKPQVKEVAVEEAVPKEQEVFVRIIRYPLKPEEHYQAFQPEVIIVEDGKVVKRTLVDKKNTFEYAFSKALEYIDLRNESLPHV